MSQEIIEKLLKSYFDSMSAMDSDGWKEIFAQDALIYDPVGNPPKNVAEDIDKIFSLISGFFEKLELSQDNVFIAGNSAAVKWTMNVLAKNKRNATTDGISIFEINDAGKIQKVSSYWDEAGMMAKLKG